MRTAALAEYAVGLGFSELSRQAVEQAQHLLRDALGIAVFASRDAVWG